MFLILTVWGKKNHFAIFDLLHMASKWLLAFFFFLKPSYPALNVRVCPVAPAVVPLKMLMLPSVQSLHVQFQSDAVNFTWHGPGRIIGSFGSTCIAWLSDERRSSQETAEQFKWPVLKGWVRLLTEDSDSRL